MFKKERKLSEFNSIKKTLNWAFINILEKKEKFYYMKNFSEDTLREFNQLIVN